MRRQTPRRTSPTAPKQQQQRRRWLDTATAAARAGAAWSRQPGAVSGCSRLLAAWCSSQPAPAATAAAALAPAPSCPIPRVYQHRSLPSSETDACRHHWHHTVPPSLPPHLFLFMSHSCACACCGALPALHSLLAPTLPALSTDRWAGACAGPSSAPLAAPRC